MKTLQKLSDQEIEELKTIGIIAKNWYAVSYDGNTVPYAMFNNEAYAIAYRDKFSATSIIEPWPMIVKDYRNVASQFREPSTEQSGGTELSSPTVKESKPLIEHFVVETDAGTTLRTFDYIKALEKYISSLETRKPLDR